MYAYKSPLNQSPFGWLLNRKITTANKVRCRASVNIHSSTPPSETETPETDLKTWPGFLLWDKATQSAYAHTCTRPTALQLFSDHLLSQISPDVGDVYDVPLCQRDVIPPYRKENKYAQRENIIVALSCCTQSFYHLRQWGSATSH